MDQFDETSGSAANPILLDLKGPNESQPTSACSNPMEDLAILLYLTYILLLQQIDPYEWPSKITMRKSKFLASFSTLN